MQRHENLFHLAQQLLHISASIKLEGWNALPHMMAHQRTIQACEFNCFSVLKGPVPWKRWGTPGSRLAIANFGSEDGIHVHTKAPGTNGPTADSVELKRRWIFMRADTEWSVSHDPQKGDQAFVVVFSYPTCRPSSGNPDRFRWKIGSWNMPHPETRVAEATPSPRVAVLLKYRFFLDLFSGPNAPITSALLRLRRRTAWPMDMVKFMGGPSFDLTSEKDFDVAIRLSWTVDRSNCSSLWRDHV